MDIISLLNSAILHGASDVHLIVSSPTIVRINGLLQSLDDESLPLTAEDMNEALIQITTPEQREVFKDTLELDSSYTLTGVGRVRCNIAWQQGTLSMALRLLPPNIPSIEELGVPDLCRDLILKPRGLVMISGPTGSGKTTTLAAMIRYLNENEQRHIVTIEDPIEYVHTSINCLIAQRELGVDTLSFQEALRHVLRQDPDVILVGEMRDLETAAAVLTIAETGHLVLTTGHAPSAPQAMERVIDLFPPHERYLAQTRLASLLVGVLCQALVPRINEWGRVAAVEVMLANPAVRNLIREGKLYQLPNVIRTNADIGMVNLDQSLIDLYLKGIIGWDDLFAFCNNGEEVEKLIGKVRV